MSGRRGLWFVERGPWAVGAAKMGTKEARKKPSGEGPERRQRGAPPRQDPCELISIGRQQGSAIRRGPMMLSGSAPGSGRGPTG